MNKWNSIGYIDDSMVKLAQDRYYSSKQKSIVDSKQKINGKLYPGKTAKMKNYNLKAVAALVGIMIVGTTIISKQDMVNEYHAKVNEINASNFDDVVDKMHYETYNINNPDSLIESIMEGNEIISQINDEKRELKETGDYGFFDGNRLTEDAIKNVALENAPSYLEEVRDFYEEEKGGMGL